MNEIAQDIYKTFKRLFTKPSIKVIAQEVLYDAEVELLKAQAALEWAQSHAEFQTIRVARLKKYNQTLILQELN